MDRNGAYRAVTKYIGAALAAEGFVKLRGGQTWSLTSSQNGDVGMIGFQRSDLGVADDEAIFYVNYWSIPRPWLLWEVARLKGKLIDLASVPRFFGGRVTRHDGSEVFADGWSVTPHSVNEVQLALWERLSKTTIPLLRRRMVRSSLLEDAGIGPLLRAAIAADERDPASVEVALASLPVDRIDPEFATWAREYASRELQT